MVQYKVQYLALTTSWFAAPIGPYYIPLIILLRQAFPKRHTPTKAANLQFAQTAQATRHAEFVAIDNMLRAETDLSLLRECDL